MTPSDEAFDAMCAEADFAELRDRMLRDAEALANWPECSVCAANMVMHRFYAYGDMVLSERWFCETCEGDTP
jgi:hypothetical protein